MRPNLVKYSWHDAEHLRVGGRIDVRVRYTLEYTRTNLQNDLSLPRLASVANISVWHICRLFKRELGISPIQYVKVLRLRSAAALLASSSLSIKEVMAAVGINDESHFVKDFKAFAGHYPTQYRTHHRTTQ